MRVLVTGATGFMGGALMARFLERGFVVVATYRRARPALPPGDTERISFFRCDLGSDPLDFPRVDLIVHAAGAPPSGAAGSLEDQLAGNVRTTLRVAEYARKVEPRLFVYLSTTAVYGRVTERVLNEETPRVDAGVHGASRYLGEAVLHEVLEFPRLIVRLPEVVGPGCFEGRLGRKLQSALRGAPVEVASPDAPYNAITDVAEVERLILHAFDRRVAGIETINLGTRRPMAAREVAETLIRLAGSSSEIVEGGLADGLHHIDTTRLEQRLGFTPVQTKRILERYVRGSIVATATEAVREIH